MKEHSATTPVYPLSWLVTLLVGLITFLPTVLGAVPVFDQDSAAITHRYFPLKAGAVFTYTGYGDAKGIGLTARVIGVETVDGVRCMKWTSKKSIDYLQSFWMAQDTQGNLWLLRKHDAHPLGGYDETDYPYLPAQLQVGAIVTNQQDEYKVVSLSARVAAPYRNFSECLHLRLEEFGDSEEDFFAPGIGLVKIAFAGSENGGWHLASTSGFTPPAQDITWPTVAITFPPINGRVSNAVVQVRGKAADSGGLAAVWFQLNNSAWSQPVSSNGWRDWSVAQVELPGTNVLRAYSVDASGNVSLTNVVKFVHVLTAPLALEVRGRGAVTPFAAGQLLEIGRRYTLQATPLAGQVFSNWTGSFLSSSNMLTFVMASNLVIEANFVPNPFLPVAGQFNGLFRNPSAVEHGMSGSFKAAVQRSGLFTASLQTGARKLAFTGRFGLEGKATNTVARSGTNALTVELWLKLDGSEEMIGRVTDGSWSSELLADRAVFNARANPATDFAGQYTMLIPGGTNGSVMEPAGDGFASVIITRAGLATIRSTLADGTAAVLAVPVSAGGDVPLYLSLYGGAGSASGWLRVLPSSEIDLIGEVAWFKPARPRPAIYTNGFALGLLVTGSVYTPFETNRLFDAEMASVAFTEGGLMDAFTKVVTLGPSGRVTNASLMNKLTLKAVSATGLFTGSVVPPEGTKPVPFKGALLQRQGYGAGFFLNAGQSGQLRLGP